MRSNLARALACFAVALSMLGCATTTDYDRQVVESASQIPAYEQAFRNEGCFEVRFKFANSMAFTPDDALVALRCLEIEKTRNSLRWKARGIIEDDELAAHHAYENFRAIFTFFSSGELSLDRARELYLYASEKAVFDAQAEMARSNQILAQGLENQRLVWERESRSRAAYFNSMMRSSPTRAPLVTRCTFNSVIDTVTCTTQ